MKERLTGAIILVALLVLLVPELLTGPSRSVRTAQPASNADGAQMRSYTINLADDAAHGSAAPPVTETPTPADPPVSESAAQPGSSANAVDGSDAAATRDTETERSADAPSPSSDSAPSSAERGQPAAAGRTEPERVASATRSDSVTPTPEARPESPKPAATARVEAPKPAPRVEQPPTPRASESPARGGSADAKPTSGWAVQVGSFASRENAERLARELKGKGFAATVSQSPKGRRLWRVRVGPEADRAAAAALGTKLRSAGQSGALVPYP